ncbi:hypothetical protein NIES4073_19890 [Kalymmatonema gypsitolerans NIES-4073]|nr:hypothetical protein NIES4073_19890 [Scytonema sp. NIES-4073]
MAVRDSAHVMFFVTNHIAHTAPKTPYKNFMFTIPLKFFIPGFNPLKWRLQELIIARTIQSKKVVSTLEIRYWSMTPYKLGDRAIKFSA